MENIIQRQGLRTALLRAWAGDSSEFTSRFSSVTQETFSQYANGLLNLPAARNSFCEYLVNRIGRVYVNAMAANNPLAFFRGEDLDFGASIEDVFVEIAKSVDFDPTGKDNANRKLPDVKTLFYYKNIDLTYKVSISDKELRKAFVSDGEMAALLERITGSLYEGMKHDSFVLMKELLAGYDGYYYVHVDALDGTEDKARAFGKALRKAATFTKFDNTQFNASGVMNNIPADNGVLIIKADAMVDLDFDYLANVFNLTAAELKGRIVEVDNFNASDNIVAVYCDERFIQNHYLYENVETFRNSEGRFTNYTLVTEAIFAVSKFMSAIALTTADVLTITMNANGGTGAMPDRTALVGVPMTTPFNKFVAASGKTFNGWSKEAAGTSPVGEIANVSFDAEGSLYAVWK